VRNYRHLKVDFSRDSFVDIAIDMQGRRLNVLDEEFFEELVSIVDLVEGDSLKRSVVIRSGKEKGYVVGADLKRILEVRQDSEICAFLKTGQDAFSRLEGLKVPTIAWIDGPCLGGGLELALACHYRIASNAADTQLGLPESKLGLTPGWGGTQRFPARVGITVGMELLFSGEAVGVERAVEIGLIDGIWSHDDQELEKQRWVERLKGRPLPNVRRLSEEDRYRIEWNGCQTKRSRAATMSGDSGALLSVPARKAIASYIDIGINKSFEAGQRAEREHFFELLSRPEVQDALQRFAKPKPK
jgi:3-hydroxyacyl-CoA dehydrogenase/enoyl-CoA hydratase/3-hydroxybutyryl-CoA epimerase